MVSVKDMPLLKAYVPEKLPDEDGMSYEFRKYKSIYYFSKMGLQATPYATYIVTWLL